MGRGRPKVDVAERLMRRVEKDSETGCWLWIGGKNKCGYGQIGVDGRMVGAHRVAFELYVGPIPDKLTLDHLCRVRHCVNPSHLEPVTHRENVLRGIGPPALHAKKTHCPQGHKYSGENLYVTPRGQRYCRECRRASDRKRYGQRKDYRREYRQRQRAKEVNR